MPEGSSFYGDSTYTEYDREEWLKKQGIQVIFDYGEFGKGDGSGRHLLYIIHSI